MHNYLRLFTLLVAVSLVGCGAAIPTIKPYKMDIQQGNVLTSEMLLKLRPGMTKSQVRFILGTPLLVDSFHNNRWDYFYQLRKQGKIINQRRVILDFEKDLLVRVRGDVVPKGQTVEDVKKQLEAETKEKPSSDEQKEEVADPNAPIIEPIEKPDVEVVETPSDAQSSEPSQLAPDETASEVNEENTPASVLAVPIPVTPQAPVETAPTEAVPTADTQSKPETSKQNDEAVKPSLENTQDVENAAIEKAAPVAEPVANQALTVEKASEFNNSIDGERKVFRLDRQLKSIAPVQSEVSEPASSTEEKAVPDVNETPVDVGDEEEYGYFERILEKIGF